MDLNGDGHLDILSGSYSRMEKSMAGLFQVLWGTEEHKFKTAEVLNGTDGEPLIIPLDDPAMMTLNICTRPTACDWDNDGDLDLVVGNFAGSFFVFKGEGKGVFDPVPSKIMTTTEGKALTIPSAHSDPFVVDWDGDGDLDLLSGSSSGGVFLAENTAGPDKVPALKEFEPLIEITNQVTYGEVTKEEDLTGPASSTRVFVADVNEDGKLDILVGDSIALISPAEGLSLEEFKTKQKEWNDKSAELSKQMSQFYNDQGEVTDEEAMQKVNLEFSRHYNTRKDFMTEDLTGFVWLYIQK